MSNKNYVENIIKSGVFVHTKVSKVWPTIFPGFRMRQNHTFFTEGLKTSQTVKGKVYQAFYTL